ncbi:MAG TPA: hypothetical protein VFX74_03635, partial [Candidatus Limnocylindria bacterium]|nr:hypothetical protein [Candidatus Limnocylindria bacterium]
MDLMIALIPALPLAGFLFAVLVGPRLDRVPTHGHDAHAHPADAHAPEETHDAHAHDAADAADLTPLASEELQGEMSPHA